MPICIYAYNDSLIFLFSVSLVGLCGWECMSAMLDQIHCLLTHAHKTLLIRRSLCDLGCGEN